VLSYIGETILTWITSKVLWSGIKLVPVLFPGDKSTGELVDHPPPI